MANPRTVHPFDRWTQEEQSRVLAGNTVRRGRRSDSVDSFVLSGIVLLGLIVIGVPVMAWIMGRYVIGFFWR